MEIRARYNTLLGYTVLVLGTITLKNNTNQINSRILTKVFFPFVQKNDYHHRPIPRGSSTFQNWFTHISD